MSYYTGVGDYYSGKGDPGLFGAIGSVLGKVGKVAGAVLPGPIGGVVRGVSSLISGGQPTGSTVPVPRPAVPQQRALTTPRGPIPSIGPVSGMTINERRTAFGGMPTCASGACAPGYHLDKTLGVKCVRNRRTNYTNPRALSRAAKRLDGFVGVARKALKSTNYKVVSKNYKQNWRKPLKR